MIYQNWVKKNTKFKTIEDVIESNTGIPLNEFLNPPQNPYIANIELATELLSKVKDKGLPVHIVADYDCDGVCAASIMYLGLKAYGLNPSVRIPRRFSEGYGLSMKIIDEINNGMIITVDNGITALEQIKVAKEKGLKVIVTDHHLPVTNEKTGEILLPDADVIVDPKATTEQSEFYEYCGAALAYCLIKELIQDDIVLSQCKALAGIATVADVMPLIGDNRNLVIDSLKLTRQRKVTLGLEVLLNQLNLQYLTESDYGFKIGPIINAAGRLYDDGPKEVFDLLTTTASLMDGDYDSKEYWCQEQVKKLLKWNSERQSLSKRFILRAENIMKENGLTGTMPLIIYDPECPEGIIGIVAGKLAEKYQTPTLMFADSTIEGVLKGSGRNYGNVHLKQLLDKGKDLFVKYGGHSGAAGMSIKKENLIALRSVLSKELEGKNFGIDPDTLYYDLDIPVSMIPMMIQKLHIYAPFGEGNPAVVFKINGFECSPVDGKFYRTLGNMNEHIKFLGKNISAIGFDMKKLYEEMNEPKTMDFIGALTRNFYNGVFYNQIEVTDFNPLKTEKTDTYNTLKDLLNFI